MSFHHSPKIVTDGLVLCLDAANKKSYSGSGTIWKDLVGSNNGTLVGGVSYSSKNSGIFLLDGIDGYITIPIDLTSTKYTIIAAARYTGVTNNRIISSNSNNWLLGWWFGQTNKYYAEGWVSPDSGGSTETSWIIYAGTGDPTADLWSLYRDGKLIVTPNNQGSSGPSGIRIGTSGVYTGEISKCEVSFIIVYNRVLSSAEILQNYNALKGRFNL
jgi:hypothetical protein